MAFCNETNYLLIDCLVGLYLWKKGTAQALY